MMLRPSSINQLTFSPLGALYAYLLSLPNQVIFIPLLDPAGTTNPRVYNPALAKGRNIVVNGTFASDTIWTKGTGWTISGGAANKAPGSGTNLTQALPMTVGVIYESIYDVLNYLAGSVVILVGNTAPGTLRSANGTYLQNIACAGVPTLFFSADLLLNASIDNASIKQLNIPANSMTAAATGAVAQGEYWSFDGTSDFINLYTNSLNSAIDPNEITINLFAQTRGLSDATSRFFYRFERDGNNTIRLFKSATLNTITATIAGSGVVKSTNIVLPDSNWHMITITISFSNDELKTYLDGALVATVNALGEFVGNLSSNLSVIGATSTAGTSSFNGDMRLFQIFNAPLSAAEIANIYALSGL